MATATLSPLAPDLSDDFLLRRFSVEEYHRLLEVGILRSGDPYELLDGWIVQKMPQNPPHVSTANRLARRLRGLLGGAWVLRTGNPITLASSEPEPDLVVAVGTDERYDDRHPTAKEVALVVEVSDSSLGRDQRPKLSIYARSKIVEYWIVNLVDRRVEVYTDPRGGKNPTYRARQDYGPDDAVPVVLAGKTIGSIPVREILPR